MDYVLEKTNLQENERPIYILSERVNTLTTRVDHINIRLDSVIEEQNAIKKHLQNITDLLNNRPKYFTVGQIALKQQVSDRTVRRRIKEEVIPYERYPHEKSYRIPANAYYESLTSNGKSEWFQNHTQLK